MTIVLVILAIIVVLIIAIIGMYNGLVQAKVKFSKR